MNMNQTIKSDKIDKSDKTNIADETEQQNSSPRPTVEQIEQEISRIEIKQEIHKAVSGTLKTLIVIAAAIVLTANLIISVLSVSRSNMSPALQDGDIVVALRWVGVNQGDIIAFYYNNKILLKRVIAKAGDWVDIDENGIVYVNKEALDEPYITERSLGECDIELPYQVPDGSLFVMGDQREKAADSRLTEIGPVSAESVVGKVFLRVWPHSRIEYLG